MLSDDHFSVDTNSHNHLRGDTGLDGRLFNFVLEYSPLLRTRFLGRGAIGSTPDFESVDLGSSPGAPTDDSFNTELCESGQTAGSVFFD